MAVAHKIAEKCIWSLDGVADGVGTILSLEKKDICKQVEVTGDTGELAMLVLTDRRTEITMESMTGDAPPAPGGSLTIDAVAYIVRESEIIYTAGQAKKIRVVAWLNATFA